MGNISKRVKYGKYYYLEYFLVGFLTELCPFMNDPLKEIVCRDISQFAQILMFCLILSFDEAKKYIFCFSCHSSQY